MTVTHPNTWKVTDLGEVAELVMGQAPPGDTCNTNGLGTVFVKAGEFGVQYPVVREWTTKPLKVAKRGDVLICVVGATCGKLNLAIDAAIGRSVAAIRPTAALDTRFLWYQLMPKILELRASSAGSAQGVLSSSDLRSIRLLIPPLAEQDRIVAAIEERLSRLDAAVGGLRRASVLIKRFQATVLNSASADGTSQQRASRGTPGSDAREWLQELVGDGAVPESVDARGWVSVPLMRLARASGYGSSEKCDYDGAGPPVLRIPNIVSGRIELADLKRARQATGWSESNALAPGDMLIVRTNGSRGLIGRAAIVESSLDRAHYFASYLIRLRLHPDPTLWRWLNMWWSSPRARHLLTSMAATSAGQYNISLGKLERLQIPLPPRAEAEQILATVDRQMSLSVSADNALDTSLSRAAGLRQSILKRAFEGKLVPQDAHDEPAGALLDRIRASRATPSARAKKSRRSA